MYTHHELKINQDYAIANDRGEKPWEIRKNDRNFIKGDTITFKVIDCNGVQVGQYDSEITYIFYGGEYGLDEGYCIFTLETF